MSNPAPEHFTRWVHDAYNHLYDVHHLQNHPLGEWLGSATAETDTLQHSQMLHGSCWPPSSHCARQQGRQHSRPIGDSIRC